MVTFTIFIFILLHKFLDAHIYIYIMKDHVTEQKNTYYSGIIIRPKPKIYKIY